MSTPTWTELQEDLHDAVSDLAGYGGELPEIWAPSQVQGIRDLIAAITKTLGPVAAIVEDEFGACTCSDNDTAGSCACVACAKAADTTHACQRRTDADRDRRYDGMCDRCWEAARDIAPCGLRVAEHRPGLFDDNPTTPTSSNGAAS